MPDPTRRSTEKEATLLAFDFGTKRIGVAVGELILRQAHPLTTIHSQSNEEKFSAIAALINEWKPKRLVVGLPLALDGSAHEMTARCTRFANQLRGRFCLPVDFAEERLSSVEAQERLQSAGATKNHDKLDALAAQVILEAYFEQGH